MNNKNITFTNSAGDTFPLLPLNPMEEQLIQQQLLDEWKASGKTIPEPPYYEATTAAGEVQRIMLRSRDDADTPELVAAWDAYEAAETALQKARSEKFMISCFLCVDANPDDYPRWKMRMKARGMAIPEDEFDKLVLFANTWVIRAKEDIPGLIIAVSRTIANVSEEAMKAAEAMFQRSVEESLANWQSRIA